MTGVSVAAVVLDSLVERPLFEAAADDVIQVDTNGNVGERKADADDEAETAHTRTARDDHMVLKNAIQKNEETGARTTQHLHFRSFIFERRRSWANGLMIKYIRIGMPKQRGRR